MAAEKGEPTLEERVLPFIVGHRLASRHEPLLVAVSGGADSVCLLHILSRLRGELGVTLHVAHLNHQLRGAEADADADYVSGLAGRLGIPATIERRDVGEYQARHRLSREEAAREVRYTFLAEVAGRVGARRVAVGHTRDDHIETVLMHLIRGAGTRGLRGLQPLTELALGGSRITVIRPLLPLSHEETAGYCAHHRLAPRIDSTNLSLSPLRNRIRHELLPLLAGYNPRIADALLRTARIAGDDTSFLEEQVAGVWEGIARRQGDTVILDRDGFCQLPPSLQRYLLRAAVESLAGNVRDIEMRHIEGIMAARDKPAGKSLNLPSGLVFSIDYARFLIGRDPAALSPFPALSGEVALNVPGETELPGGRIKATVMTPPAVAGDSGGCRACLDLDKAGDRLVVRTRRRGDRFQPLGMSQPKKVNEFMIDAKVPRPWRQQVPIVCSPEHILWVVGWRIDDRVKVTGATRRVLLLEMERV